MKLSDFLTDVGRPVAFYPSLVKALGDRNEAIFICQMAYWRGKGENKEGWIYKESEEIESETSLTYKEQRNVRGGLKGKGLLLEKYARTEHKMYFKVNWDAVNSLWEQFTIGHMPIGQVLESQVPLDQWEGGSLPEGSSLNSNTENTPENTPQNINRAALDLFVSYCGAFEDESECIRWIELYEKEGVAKATEILKWIVKKEIHLNGRATLLDSIEPASENWKSKPIRVSAKDISQAPAPDNSMAELEAARRKLLSEPSVRISV